MLNIEMFLLFSSVNVIILLHADFYCSTCSFKADKFSMKRKGGNFLCFEKNI